jgi:hypothetical protein
MSKEFDREFKECHLCKVETHCILLKTAHVPLYAWVCNKCRDGWVAE